MSDESVMYARMYGDRVDAHIQGLSFHEQAVFVVDSNKAGTGKLISEVFLNFTKQLIAEGHDIKKVSGGFMLIVANGIDSYRKK